MADSTYQQEVEQPIRHRRQFQEPDLAASHHRQQVALAEVNLQYQLALIAVQDLERQRLQLSQDLEANQHLYNHNNPCYKET